MKGLTHDRIRCATVAGVAAGLLLSVLPAVAAGVDGVERLPGCADARRQMPGNGAIVRPWQVLLDGSGAVTGHRVTLRRGGSDTDVRTGRRGFALTIGSERLLVGERSSQGTRLSMVDVQGGCHLWTIEHDRLLYPRQGTSNTTVDLQLASFDPASRRFDGILPLDVDTGATSGLIDGECITVCEPHDGEISSAALQAPLDVRPTPTFSGGGWPKDKRLTFRWRSGAVPPAWAKDPLKGAAADASGSSLARSPEFAYKTSVSNAVGYTGTMPSYCGSSAIACAARSMPSWWGIWLRPHGSDFAWGTLRWCQKVSGTGCFDIRRVALHELGHVSGLTHPSVAGFTLHGHDSVMQGITPAKPKAGSGRHAFGRCDVATLQELYDTTDNKTPVSTCNDLATKLSLWTTKSPVARGQTVKLKAELRVEGRSSYRQLANNPLNGRSLKLKYRRTGSGDSWKTLWMRPLHWSGRYELSIAPTATWEFKAVFPSPDDEGLRYSRSDVVKVRVLS